MRNLKFNLFQCSVCEIDPYENEARFIRKRTNKKNLDKYRWVSTTIEKWNKFFSIDTFPVFRMCWPWPHTYRTQATTKPKILNEEDLVGKCIKIEWKWFDCMSLLKLIISSKRWKNIEIDLVFWGFDKRMYMAKKEWNECNRINFWVHSLGWKGIKMKNLIWATKRSSEW